MALLELCEVPEFDCSRLVVCADRTLNDSESKCLRRDLGWVGFEPLTLADWTANDDILSERWVFLGIDV
jgi:Ornithine decarboxylase antizyme